MKNLILLSTVILLVVDLVFCQQLEALILHKIAKTIKRFKLKGKDKKALKYGFEAKKKASKGTVEGAVGVPLKIIGIILGPLGIPKKAVGTVLKGKSVFDKTAAGVFKVKKLSRDSVRYG